MELVEIREMECRAATEVDKDGNRLRTLLAIHGMFGWALYEMTKDGFVLLRGEDALEADYAFGFKERPEPQEEGE